MKPAHEILEQAAVEMIERGHGKKKFVTDDGKVCLFGACRVQFDDCWEVDQAMTAVGDYLYDAINCGLLCLSPEDWNDLPETTETQAIGVLLEAARLAKEAML